jgi:hypothetical protein
VGAILPLENADAFAAGIDWYKCLEFDMPRRAVEGRLEKVRTVTPHSDGGREMALGMARGQFTGGALGWRFDGTLSTQAVFSV